MSEAVMDNDTMYHADENRSVDIIGDALKKARTGGGTIFGDIPKRKDSTETVQKIAVVKKTISSEFPIAQNPPIVKQQQDISEFVKEQDSEYVTKESIPIQEVSSEVSALNPRIAQRSINQQQNRQQQEQYAPYYVPPAHSHPSATYQQAQTIDGHSVLKNSWFPIIIIGTILMAILCVGLAFIVSDATAKKTAGVYLKQNNESLKSLQEQMIVAINDFTTKGNSIIRDLQVAQNEVMAIEEKINSFTTKTQEETARFGAIAQDLNDSNKGIEKFLEVFSQNGSWESAKNKLVAEIERLNTSFAVVKEELGMLGNDAKDLLRKKTEVSTLMVDVTRSYNDAEMAMRGIQNLSGSDIASRKISSNVMSIPFGDFTYEVNIDMNVTSLLPQEILLYNFVAPENNAERRKKIINGISNMDLKMSDIKWKIESNEGLSKADKDTLIVKQQTDSIKLLLPAIEAPLTNEFRAKAEAVANKYDAKEIIATFKIMDNTTNKNIYEAPLFNYTKGVKKEETPPPAPAPKKK